MTAGPESIVNPLPPEAADAVAVVRRLRAAGHVALLAGGCVRDLLLGRPPKDFDVATDAPPNRVRELFPNTQAVGAAFGVILVRHRGSQIEVATFRTDLEYRDGRRPEGVVFSTPPQDAARRDFTINGLFLDPVTGEVIDYVGGKSDLAARQIRAIGHPAERFAEDHLRLLRAVRFAARLGFEIEPATAAAIVSHGHELVRISPERVADELRRMLTGPGFDRAWRLLHDLNLFPPIFRFLPVAASSIEPARSLFLEQERPPTFGLAVAVLTLDDRWQRSGRPDDIRPWLEKSAVGKLVRGMRESLKLSNEESAEMGQVLMLVGGLLADASPTVAAKKRFLARPEAGGARVLLEILGRAGLFAERADTLSGEFAVLEKTDFAPVPLVTGDDLTAAGAKPGPKFKAALDSAYDEQLEGRIDTVSQALQFALRRV